MLSIAPKPMPVMDGIISLAESYSLLLPLVFALTLARDSIHSVKWFFLSMFGIMAVAKASNAIATLSPSEEQKYTDQFRARFVVVRQELMELASIHKAIKATIGDLQDWLSVAMADDKFDVISLDDNCEI